VAEQEKNRRKNNFSQAPLIGSDPQMRRVKILLLGDSGVGKSSLILRWTADTFSPTLVGTVGVNFKSKKVVIKTEAIQVQVRDTAGQEQFHKITTSYYKGANGIMVVYDVSDKKSLDNVEYWVKNIKSHATDAVQVVIVGNKTDLRTADNKDNCFDADVGKEFSNKYGVPYFETSAKDSTNVDDAFVTLVKAILSSSSSSDPQACGPPKSPSAPPQRQSILERASQSKASIFKRLSKGGDSSDTSPSSTPRDMKEKCTIS
jgi:small GTP-binding protein